MEQSLITQLEQQLKKEQARLRAALGSVAKAEDRGFTPTFQDMDSDEDANQDEVEQYEVNVETEAALEPELYRVEHALTKISQGSYGVCEKCGAEIPAERLEANPSAEFCMEHAA